MTAISNKNYDLIEILSDNIDDLVYILDESFKCEYLNEKTHLNSIGYSCLSKKFTDYIHATDQERAIKFLKNIKKSGKAVEEFRIRSNKEYKYYEVKGKRFFDEHNNVKIFLISKDISKFKDLEFEWINRAKKLKEMTETLPEIRFWKLMQTKDSKTVIQKTHEMLNLVIDNIPQYIYWKDVNLNYLGCNHNYAMVNDLKDTNLIIGKKDSELPWPKNNLIHIYEREKFVIKNNKAESSIESWILPNGNKVWFEVNRIPLHDLEKNIMGLLSTYNDITNRIIAEQKLSHSEQKYREILENIKEGYFEVDLRGTYLFISKSFSEIFDYTESEILGRNYKEFTDYMNRDKVFKAFNQVYNTGINQKFLQFEFKKKDGKTIILETSVNLKFDSEGKKVGFYGIVHDITDKFRLQQELKQSEEKYRLISENAYDLICIIDQNLKFEYANKQPFFDILGYTKEEIIYKSVLKFIHPEDKKLVLNTMIEGFKKGEGILEIRIKHKNGNWIWIELKGRTFNDRDGNIKGIIIGRDINERKIAEERLKKSEKKFRHLFENSPFTIWLLNSKGIIIDCNLTMNQLLSKYTKNDIINKHYTEVLSMFERPEYFIPFFKEKFKSFIKGEKIEPVEFQMTRADSKSLWLTVQSSQIKLGDEILNQVIIQDITEKKQAEEDLKNLNKELEQVVLERTKKLRESEEKFRTIAEQSSMGIVILQEGYLKYFNNAISEITGYTSEEINNWSQNEFLQKIYDKDQLFVFEHLKRKLNKASKLPSHYTCRIITFSKQIKWIELHSQLIEYKGKPAVLATLIDITDKRITEEKLKESEEKYRHLFENSPYAIVLLDLKGKIIDVNSTTEKVFGYNKEELINKNYLDLLEIYPSKTIPALRNLTDLLSDGEFMIPKMKPQMIEIYKKNQTKAWVESEISSIKLGNQIFIQIIIQDITDKKIAEQKLIESERILREQNIELRELDRLKTDFISIAAHELKTPLVSIRGYIDLILMRERDLELEIKEDLERALINCRRLENYVNRLMDVMKIDAKKMDLEFSEKNVYNIIQNSLSELHFQIKQKKLLSKLDINKDIKLIVDPFRIYQVFSNLISNAINYSKEGGVIEISAEEQDKDYIFIIKDYGKGLNEKEMDKLFGKFVTISQNIEKSQNFEKGSGLGLYIAKGIIEAHGGKIWAKSEGPDKGTEFRFTLPIRND